MAVFPIMPFFRQSESGSTKKSVINRAVWFKLWRKGIIWRMFLLEKFRALGRAGYYESGEPSLAPVRT